MTEIVQIIEGLTEAHGDGVREVWRVPNDGQMKNPRHR
jgi:hypothetical protein